MARPNAFRLSIVAAAVLVAALLALVAAKPTQAAFPGSNGKIVFEGGNEGERREIYSVNPNGSALTRLTFGRANSVDPAWSADGRKVAFVSERDGNTEIYTLNADGSALTRLTYNRATDETPAWSPNGSRIVFSSDRDGGFEVYTIKANGSDPRQITNDPGSDRWPAWSPDGSTILFTRDYDDDISIYEVDPRGGSLSRLATDALDPDWSPDGTRIAFSRDGDSFRTYDLWVMDADGTNQSAIFEGTRRVEGSTPAWSPDGRKIAHLCYVDEYAICTMNADGTRRTVVDTGGAARKPDWQPGPPLFRVDGDTTVTMLFAELIGMSGRFMYGTEGIPDEKVALWQLPAGDKDYAPVPGAETMTDKDGSFSFENVRPEKNTNYQVRFAGDENSMLPAVMSPIKAVTVKVLVSLGLSTEKTKVGQPVVMSGEVRPGHSGGVNLTITRDGKKVATKSAGLHENSRYSLTYAPPKAGDYSVVASFSGGDDYAGNASPKRSFIVVR